MTIPAYLTANISRISEPRKTGKGDTAITIGLAHNTRKQDESGEWVDGPVTWFDAGVFGSTADNTLANLKVGDRVIVIGRFVTRTWDDEHGSHSKLEIVVDELGRSERFARKA